MSRSYKKTPICKHPRGGSNKAARTCANRAYRRKMNRSINLESVSSQAKNDYRKYYESWDIVDYVSYEPIIWAKAAHKRYCDNVDIAANKYLRAYYEKYAKMTEAEYLHRYWYPYFYRR